MHYYYFTKTKNKKTTFTSNKKTKKKSIKTLQQPQQQKAKLPDYNPISSFPVDKENDERELEIPRWSPGAMADGDLLMFLRAARSMAAFQGKYPPEEILKSNDTHNL